MSETKSKITLTTGAAVSQKRLVQLSTGTAIHNVATTKPIGVADYAAASGDNVAVNLLSGEQTIEITAAGAISLDADVYAAAAGKVQALPTDGGNYIKIGVAMEAATADGDIIEILPYAVSEEVQVAETATGTYTLDATVATEIDSSAAAVTGTLGDGDYVGQLKTIVMTDASNSSTVSITNHETSDPEVATFDAVDEYWLGVWTGTEWATVSNTCTFV